MAANRAVTSLTIALIVFVMLSFVLAITTYLGFQQRFEERQKAEAATQDAQTAKAALDTELAEKQRLRDVIGTAAETADAIEAERNTLLEQEFSAFNEDPKSLRKLVEWLDGGIASRDEKIKALDTELATLRADKEADVKKAIELQKVAEAELAKAQAELKTVVDDFNRRRQEFETQAKDLTGKQKAALDESERLRAITEELAKLGPLLAPDLRQRFTKTPDGGPEPWPERVRFVFQELKNREATIRDLNAVLARLRVADPELQNLVIDATPEDDRIDAVDGRVVSVNEADRTVLLDFDSTRGMRPGLVLLVFDPGEDRPRIGDRKAIVEITEVESPSLARARVRRDSVGNLVLSGDRVATSLWSPGESPEIVIVGFVRDSDGVDLKDRVARVGARIAEQVTPQTTLVVDAGLPSSNDIASGIATEWTGKPVNETLRRRALERAKEVGVRVVGIDGLLDMLGIDRAALAGAR